VQQTWAGGTDTSWFNPSNWSPATVPGPTSLVAISPAANQPILSADTTIAHLDVQAGASLSVQTSGSQNVTLTLTNGATNQGAIDLVHLAGPGGGIAAVSSTGGLFSNTSAGVIGSSTGDSSGGRALSGNLNNLGNINVNYDLSLGAGSTLANSGSLTVGPSATLSLTGSTFSNFNSGTGVLTGGTYLVSGTLKFDNAAVTSLAANVTLNGAGAQMVSQLNADGLSGLASITSGGSLQLQNARNYSPAGSFTNGGMLGLDSNVTFSLPAGFNYTQTSSGSLELSVSGFSTFAQLKGPGSAAIAGSLQVGATNGFQPTTGNSFATLSFGSLTGTFGSFSSAGIAPSLKFVPTYSGNSVVVQVQTVTPNIVSVTISTPNVAFGNCSGGNSPASAVGTPNGQCQTPPVMVTLGGAANSVSVQATNAMPGSGGQQWVLCGSDVACAGGSTPGADEFRMKAVDNSNPGSQTQLGHIAQCDASFGCGPASGSRTEYVQLTGPTSSTNKSPTFNTTITWTASS
jgi:hypothetical protein